MLESVEGNSRYCTSLNYEFYKNIKVSLSFKCAAGRCNTSTLLLDPFPITNSKLGWIVLTYTNPRKWCNFLKQIGQFSDGGLATRQVVLDGKFSGIYRGWNFELCFLWYIDIKTSIIKGKIGKFIVSSNFVKKLIMTQSNYYIDYIFENSFCLGWYMICVKISQLINYIHTLRCSYTLTLIHSDVWRCGFIRIYNKNEFVWVVNTFKFIGSFKQSPQNVCVYEFSNVFKRIIRFYIFHYPHSSKTRNVLSYFLWMLLNHIVLKSSLLWRFSPDLCKNYFDFK